jgi:3-methyladenine DNA glycosylase AlkD
MATGRQREGDTMSAYAIALAAEIDRRINALPHQTTQPIRLVRREYTRRLRDADGVEVIAVADALVDSQRWVAYELVYHHHGARTSLAIDQVTRLGRGLNGWASVDAFARYISGPAWQHRLIPDGMVHAWAASPDRWWRRAALVSTVPLNLRSAGGSGDTARTLDICRRVVADRDDMVVKALSWALRELVVWDPAAVRGFLDDHGDAVAARVRREVTTRLETGRKDRRQAKPST